MKPKKVAILTAGGLAPCLSSAIGGLIERYTEIDPSIEIICYLSGYKGLLLGDSIKVTPEMREKAHLLHLYGGSPIGNSRVKLTNVKDCVKRGLVKEGEDPQKVAADQLVKDNVDILHTIGGDDTNTAAADLAKFLKENNYELTVIGLPKTIDNDVYPIRQSLGAWTAADTLDPKSTPRRTSEQQPQPDLQARQRRSADPAREPPRASPRDARSRREAPAAPARRPARRSCRPAREPPRRHP